LFLIFKKPSASKFISQIYSPLSQKDNIIVPSLAQNKLEPGFVTGFTDGEGSFGLYIYTNTASKIGWYVLMDFKFTIHLRDKDILYKIKIYFGAGVISKHGETLTNYSIRSIKDIPSVVNHFYKFPPLLFALLCFALLPLLLRLLFTQPTLASGAPRSYL